VSPARARLLVLFSALCFGTTGTAQALGPDASPVAVGAARIVLGGALLVAVSMALSRRAPRPMLAAGVAVAAYQLCFFAAVDDTGVAVGTVVALGSAPAMAGALGRLVLGSPLTARWAASTALATVGVLLLVVSGKSATVSVPGVVLALGAGAGYAGYTVAAKRRLDGGDTPEAVMAGAFGTGGLLLLPVLFVAGPGFLADLDGIAMIAWLGIVPTAIAYIAFARGLQGLSAGEVATLTLAEPLTAAALGAVVLGERPGGLAVAGAALVLLGLVALALPGGRTRPVVPPVASEATR
jgi:DME family drug/metabolite transporter